MRGGSGAGGVRTMATVHERFVERTPKSAALADRARALMPGGDTRAASHHPPYQLTYVRGQGNRLWDADDNEYLDLLGNYTSLVHGNAFPPVVETVQRVVPDGTAWAGRNLHQLELADELLRRIASAELVRFTNSGTEAVMLAIHIAKIATGRQKILMARNGYHGGHEDTEAGTFAGTRTEPLFGGPRGTDHATHVATFGDAESFETILAEKGHEIAAVLLEPVQGAAGIVPPPPGFLRSVAKATRTAGAVFILDEIITLRLADAGAQSLYDVTPDLTALGKIIGGGFPVGAVAGRGDLLELTDPANGRLHNSGTFNGNPVTMAAGVVALRHLTPEAIEVMHRQAERISDAIAHTARELELPLDVRRTGSLLALGAPPELEIPLHLASLNNGVYFAPRGLLALSTVFSDDDVQSVIDRLGVAMTEVSAEDRVVP